MELTLKELNACILGLTTIKEDCDLVISDKTTYNRQAKEVALDLSTTCESALTKIKEATGLKDVPEYRIGDEKEFIINPEKN